MVGRPIISTLSIRMAAAAGRLDQKLTPPGSLLAQKVNSSRCKYKYKAKNKGIGQPSFVFVFAMENSDFLDSGDDNLYCLTKVLFFHSDAKHAKKSGAMGKNKLFGTQRSDSCGRNTKCLHFEHPNGRGGRPAGAKINSTGTTFCVKSQHFPLQIQILTDRPGRYSRRGPREWFY